MTKPLAGLLALALLPGACAWELPFSGPPEPRLAVSAERSASEGLVFVVPDSENPGRTDVWRARLSDGAVEPLILTPDRDEEEAHWSERASALALKVRPAQDEPTRSPGGLVLWRAGSEQELPGDRAQGELWATWAPLDPRLAYVVRKLEPANGDEPISNGIAVVDLTTGEQAILARTERRGERYARPAFSPDGRRVVAEYVTRRPRTARIALLQAEGEPQLLTGVEYRASQPRFTRDGRTILFSSRPGRDGPRDLMRMHSDGSEAHPFASTPDSDDYQAAGSPARDEIAFLSDRDGKLDVFLVDPAGGSPRNLTGSLGMRVRKLRWSPDGAHLALTAFPYDPDLPAEDQVPAAPATAQVLVIDREGHVVFQTRGYFPDWMPPWG